MPISNAMTSTKIALYHASLLADNLGIRLCLAALMVMPSAFVFLWPILALVGAPGPRRRGMGPALVLARHRFQRRMDADPLRGPDPAASTRAAPVRCRLARARHRRADDRADGAARFPVE